MTRRSRFKPIVDARLKSIASPRPRRPPEGQLSFPFAEPGPRIRFIEPGDDGSRPDERSEGEE